VTTLLSLAIAVLAGLLIIRLPPLEGALLIGLLALVIGALIEPLVALGAALFVGPLKAYLSAEVPQLPPQVGHAFVALALTSWLIGRLSERDVHIGHVGSPLFLSLLGFLGATLLSLWDAVGLVIYGVPELVKWAEVVVLFIFVKEHLLANAEPLPTLRTADTGADGMSRRLRWLMAALLGTGVFQATVGIWQSGLHDHGPEHFRILGGDLFRAYGTFEQPNPYAGYLGMTLALTVGAGVGRAWDELTGDGRRSAGGQGREAIGKQATRPSLALLTCPSADVIVYLLGGGAALAMLVALVASWSRGAWIGFGSAVLAMAAALPRKPVWGVLLVVTLIIGGVGLYASGQLPASFTARLTTFVQDIHLEDVRGVPIHDANYAVIERLAHWQAALSMFQHNLWTGVGFGCYEAAYAEFALINWPIALGHAHNIYLNLAAETGLIGLGAYLVFWSVIIWQTWWVTRRARGPMRGLAIGLLGAWTHLTVHHLLDNLYVNNVHLQVGVLFGVTAYLVHWTNQTVSTYDR
jgi:O-antigen ligase